TLHHSGSFSAKVTLTNVSLNGIVSMCIVASLPAGAHAVSYWYNTTDPNVGQLFMNYIAYSSNDCTGAGGGDPSGALTASPTKDGNWHQINGLLKNTTAKNSLKVELFFECAPCSGAPSTTTGTVYYDDVFFDDATTTAVRLSSFSAARTKPGVRLRWRTGTEASTVGFHVYRSDGARWTRIDRQLIAARGSVAGARYSFLDRRAPARKLAYRLQAVGTDGSRTWYGRAIVAR